jgi:hypothetical protein
VAGGLEQVEADVLGRDVVAGRQGSLEEQDRTVGVGDDRVVDLDHDMPAAGAAFASSSPSISRS